MFRYQFAGALCFLLMINFVSAQDTQWKHQPVIQTATQIEADDETSEAPLVPGAETEEDILNLDLELLGQVDVTTTAPSLNLEVSSVDRSVSTVGKSPAAIYVITNEMILRSGAKTIPDVLRLAPGVHVAQITNTKWAISIRGFNNRFANSLLVQIDGRTLYNPLFAGVYWDAQDLLLEDVERIEIIRGPGATIWGANAVNGIINIITKHTKDTQGVYVQAGAGTEWNGFGGARLGGSLSDDATYRVWGKWFERDTSPTIPGFPDGTADDYRDFSHGGFRMDWEPNCCDSFMLQGAYYDGFSGGQSFAFAPMLGAPFQFPMDSSETIRGAHMLGRFTRKLGEKSDWAIQFYYDRTERRNMTPAFFQGNDRNTLDLDFQHRFSLGNHDIIWGFGYRYTDDFVRNSAGTVLNPHVRPLDRFGYFVQDRITLSEDLLFLTLGSKFSHNDYTQFEMQPSVRLLLTPNDQLSIWGAVSRAVRTPNRIEREGTVMGGFGVDFDGPGPMPPAPVPFSLNPNPNQQAGEVLAYEFGIRGQPSESFYWDVTAFYNDYTDLNNVITVSPFPPVLQFINSPTHEQTWGFEIVNTLEMTEDWRLQGGYSLFRGVNELGASVLHYPRNMLFMQSSHNIGCNWQFDLMGRYADQLSDVPTIGVLGPTSVPSYFEMDARLAWRPYDDVELFVVGRNLLDQQHNEWVASQEGLVGAETPREVYTGVNIRY